ncbi:hypothetical protein CASFOL_021244 [Castilleja foliolosa]|uniref:Uncharacterized protein n=1 Tax=Castilleja foliolosa TaxID=1961234 RepID=A0ABD3CW16_9LAMI
MIGSKDTDDGDDRIAIRFRLAWRGGRFVRAQEIGLGRVNGLRVYRFDLGLDGFDIRAETRAATRFSATVVGRRLRSLDGGLWLLGFVGLKQSVRDYGGGSPATAVRAEIGLAICDGGGFALIRAELFCGAIE